MFQGLRPNSIFYVLDKGENPSLKIGQVVSVSNPQPKFPTYTPGQFNPQPMETTVDVVVKLPNEQMEFKQLPSNMQIANSENLMISESREAMDAEVEAMYRHSKEIVESEPYHKKVMEECAKMRAVLNPQIAKDRQQEEDINNLKSEVSGMNGTLTDIKSMLSVALEKVNTKK